jgi:hypothetical protein
MNKMLKTTNTNIDIETSSVLIVEIGDFSFEKDERYHWIDVYMIGNENKKFVAQIDEENMPTIVEHEELKIFALNWFFNNVEIVNII